VNSWDSVIVGEDGVTYSVLVAWPNTVLVKYSVVVSMLVTTLDPPFREKECELKMTTDPISSKTIDRASVAWTLVFNKKSLGCFVLNSERSKT